MVFSFVLFWYLLFYVHKYSANLQEISNPQGRVIQDPLYHDCWQGLEVWVEPFKAYLLVWYYLL